MLLLRSKLLLLSFFLVHVFVHGQDKQLHIIPFSDSSKIGFKNVKGDTIFVPQFDDADHASYNSTYYYIVRKGELHGVVSMVGEMVIPMNDYRIKPCFNESFVLHKDYEEGYLYHIVSNRNESLSRMYDYIAFSQHGSQCLVEKDGELGLLNHLFEEVIMGPYKDIQPKTGWENNYFRGYLYEYYEVTSKDGIGVFDLEGNVVIEPKYKEIRPRLPNPQCGSEDVIFEVLTHDLKWGVLDSELNVLVPIQYSEINVFFRNVNRIDCYYRPSNCETEVQRLCFVEEATGKIVYNLRDKIKSKPFDNLSSFGEYILFQNDSTFGVMNSNFDIIYSTEDYKIIPYHSSWTLDFPMIKLYLPLTSAQKQQDFPFPDSDKSVLLPCDQVLYYGDSGDGKRGLLNYVSGLRIPNVYDSILIRRLPDTRYYWAFRSLEDPNVKHLDIFNEEMTLIKQLQLPAYQPELKNEHSYQGSTASMFTIMRGFDGSFGALSYKGDTLVPYLFSEFSFYPLNRSDTIPELCYFSRDNKWGIYNTNGDLLLPCEFESIDLESYPFAYFWCERNGLYEIYNDDFKMIAENCQAHFQRNKPNRFGYSEPITSRGYDRQDLLKRTLFIIKNGKLYFFEKDEWVLMNSSLLEFTQERMNLFGECIIDKYGNVQNMEDYELGTFSEARK